LLNGEKLDSNFLQIKKEIVMREIDIMSKLHHPNIVQFLGYIDDPFIIILEYIPSGDLTTNIKKLNKKQKISIMKDILKGLAYIHNRRPNNLIHRDIKPTNILLTNSKVAKIADFGLSKFYNLNKINSFENMVELDNEKKTLLQLNDNTIPVGTERYMAPEVKNTSDYDNKIDIYSCGILLYELTKMFCEDPNQRFDALSIVKILNHYNI
jgi:serine/threonine protein kinase